MNVMRWMAAGLVVVVAGCGTGPQERSETHQVGVVYEIGGGPGAALDYEVSVTLGQALEPGEVGCDLASREGMVTVPITLTMVHTHQTADAAVPEEATGPDGEPVRLYVPRYMRVEAVGGAGPMRWEPTAGTTCTDQPDLEAFVSLGWKPGDAAVMSGYLAGVPERSPGGAGLEVAVVRPEWTLYEGEAPPITVTY